MAMNVKVGTYTGTGAALPVTGVGFQPTVLFIRGGTQPMQVGTVDMGTNKMQGITGETPTTGRLTSYDTDGFTLGTDVKVNGNGVVFFYIALSGSGDITTGTYAGNATGPRAITGAGFSPDYVGIWDDLGDTGGFRTSDMATDSYLDYGGGTGLLTDRILSLDSDGFTVSFRNEVNGTGRNYYWVAVNTTASLFKPITYTGNGVDDTNITGVGFQPDFTFVNRGIGGNGSAVRFKDQVGDLSFYINSFGSAANRIQSFLSDGFQVGTDSSVNQNTNTYYTLNFKESSAGATTSTSSTSSSTSVSTSTSSTSTSISTSSTSKSTSTSSTSTSISTSSTSSSISTSSTSSSISTSLSTSTSSTSTSTTVSLTTSTSSTSSSISTSSTSSSRSTSTSSTSQSISTSTSSTSSSTSKSTSTSSTSSSTSQSTSTSSTSQSTSISTSTSSTSQSISTSTSISTSSTSSSTSVSASFTTSTSSTSTSSTSRSISTSSTSQSTTTLPFSIQIPVATIHHQSQITMPVNGDATVMDDAVMTMNGSGLMGGPTAIHPNIAARPVIQRYYTNIRKRR